MINVLEINENNMIEEAVNKSEYFKLQMVLQGAYCTDTDVIHFCLNEITPKWKEALEKADFVFDEVANKYRLAHKNYNILCVVEACSNA